METDRVILCRYEATKFNAEPEMSYKDERVWKKGCCDQWYRRQSINQEKQGLAV